VAKVKDFGAGILHWLKIACQAGTDVKDNNKICKKRMP